MNHDSYPPDYIRDVLQSIPSVAETTTMVILKQDAHGV